jgi:hypothetical protein
MPGQAIGVRPLGYAVERALPGGHIHDREGEILRRNNRRVTVLAGAVGADEPVLRALETFDLGAARIVLVATRG